MIKVVSLCKTYKKNQVLNNVSFEIPKGLITTLVGLNGAGKTTIIEILLGLRNKESGQIFIDSDSNFLSNDNKKKIGAMLQETFIYKKMFVKEAINFFGKFYENSIDIDYILDIIKLDPNKRFFELSIGQKQKLMLGLALVQNPEIIILDEPTSAMDPSSRIEFWNLLMTLKNQGKTIFVSTHNLNEAERISDNVIILHKGIIVAAGDIGFVRKNLGISKRAKMIMKEKYDQMKEFFDINNIDYRYSEFERSLSLDIKDIDSYMKLLQKSGLSEYINELDIKLLPLEEIFLEYVKN